MRYQEKSVFRVANLRNFLKCSFAEFFRFASVSASLACPLTGAGGSGIKASPERGEVSQQDSVGALRRTKVGRETKSQEKL